MHADPIMPFRSFASVALAGALTALLAPARPVIGTPIVVAQGDESDLRERQRQLEQVRAERVRQAAEIDVIEADDATVQSALTELEAEVNAQSAALGSAQQREAEAVRVAAEARAAAEATAAELESVRVTAASVALSAYMAPTGTGPLSVLNADDINAAAYRAGILATQSRSIDDVVDALGAARQDLVLRQRAAEAAEIEAIEARAETEEQLAALESAQATQERKATEVEARLEAALAEAQALAGTDAALAAEIEAAQAAIAAQLAELQRRAAAGAPVRGPAPSSGEVLAAPSPDGDVGLVRVGGITVNVSIGGAVEALLTAAAADGIALGGGGYRSSQRQIELRIAHCGGNSNYAIYQRPSSQCSPPTARPGQSNHERGLAIDFTCGDSGTIRSRSSPCFQWLAANAATYGLRNLPSEPWHWSVDGR